MVKDLQLFSFIVNEDTIDDVSLYTFKLPASVRTIYQQISKDKTQSVAYRTIFKIASTCFPSIICCNNTIYEINKNDDIWFYAIEEFNLELLKARVCEWLRKEYKDKVGGILSERFFEEWVFSKPISLKEILKNENPIIYKLIPSYYLYKLAKEQFDFTCIQRKLKFKRVIGDNIATMMTLPIRLEGEYVTPFSYFIESRLVKPIDGIGLALNFDIHIRTWEERALIDKESNYIKGNEKTSLYVYKENEYYNNQDGVFNKVFIARDKNNGFEVVDSADKLYCSILEIELEDTIYKKENKEEVVEQIILVNKKKTAKSFTQSGAGLPERNEMLAIIENKLPQLKKRAPIEFLEKASVTKLKPLRKVEEELQNLEIAPVYIVGDSKNINSISYISNKHYQCMKLYVASRREELYDKIVEICRIQLRLKQIKKYTYENEEGCLIQILPVNNDFVTLIKDKEDKEKRIDEICNVFGEASKDVLRMAIIDMPNYAKQKIKEGDPKSFVRNICREKHILTQFIDYEDNGNKEAPIEKVINTVKDMLSAAGFMEEAVYQSKKLQDNDILVGITKISTGENETILGMSKIEKGKIWIKIYKIDKWMSLQDYIFYLNASNLKKMKITIPKGKGMQVKEEVDNWIRTELMNILKQGNKVYAYVEYSLRDKLWSRVTNASFIKWDDLHIPGKENLRLIRVNSGDEIPDYFIYSKEKEKPMKNSNQKKKVAANINKESGVFKGENNTYYLVSSKSDTDKSANDITKCSRPDTPIKRPSLHEINIQGCRSEEERDEVAKLTQILRGMNITYDKHTSLPMPLYIMGRLSEYIRAIYE